MAKEKKLARVRYDDGSQSGQEKYIIEIWSDEDQCWHENMASRFVADAKHPEAGAEFVHFGIVTQVIYLVNMGYSIDI